MVEQLKEKMKKLFCLQAKGQYRAHAAEKAAISCHKALGRHVGPMIERGSEDRFTHEDKWISHHCPWDFDDELPGSPSPTRTVQHNSKSVE